MCSPTRLNANKPTNYQQRTDPRVLYPGGIYIAGDTLRHQQMGAGHMTVLRLCGPMGFSVLQWCHPMLASDKEDKLLYPDDHLIWCSKVDSGSCKLQAVFLEIPPNCINGKECSPSLTNCTLRQAMQICTRVQQLCIRLNS